jgi:hypothetical protein
MYSIKNIKKFMSKKATDRDGDGDVADGTKLERKVGTSAFSQSVKNIVKRRKPKQEREKTFSLKGFMVKFVNETAALSFTLASSVIVFVTLSGKTQTIALIATLAALAVHYTKVMLENDMD